MLLGVSKPSRFTENTITLGRVRTAPHKKFYTSLIWLLCHLMSYDTQRNWEGHHPKEAAHRFLHVLVARVEGLDLGLKVLDPSVGPWQAVTCSEWHVAQGCSKQPEEVELTCRSNWPAGKQRMERHVVLDRRVSCTLSQSFRCPSEISDWGPVAGGSGGIRLRRSSQRRKRSIEIP